MARSVAAVLPGRGVSRRDRGRSRKQIITRHGAERAVVLSIGDYRALVAHKPNFFEYLLSGPKVDDFEIEYSRDTGREIEL